jgi:hypothetical protein
MRAYISEGFDHMSHHSPNQKFVVRGDTDGWISIIFGQKPNLLSPLLDDMILSFWEKYMKYEPYFILVGHKYTP